MKATVWVFMLCSLLSVGSTAPAEGSVFFEEQFSGPTLDPSVWRTEILTSGVRWCDSYPGNWWGPGTWVAEGASCYGVAAQSPYGNATLSEGLLHLSSSNGQACPYLVSRLPGSVEGFPASGDFTLKVGIRFDRVTPWGTFFGVFQTPSTQPSGTDPPLRIENLMLVIAGDGLYSALGGGASWFVPKVAEMPSPYELHEVALDCAGTEFTIRIDGQAVYGPVTSSLRPSAVFIGNAALAYWYPTDWTSFSVDYIRVEVPDPVPVEKCSWGALKATYR